MSKRVRSKGNGKKIEIYPWWLAALTTAIFVADTATDFEIAVAVLYVAVVLAAVRHAGARGIMLIAASCMALTLVSFALTRAGAQQAGLIDCGISLVAIVATAYLSLQIKAAEAAARQAREELVHFGRIAMLGELTTAIAHEVNQPLAAIVTSAAACLRWLEGDPPNVARALLSVERIVADAKRAGGVVSSVRGLARRERPSRKRLHIDALIVETVALVQHEIDRYGVAPTLDLAAGDIEVYGDRVQLQQMLLNLLVNAIEALRSVEARPRRLTISSAPGVPGGVAVTVSDNGPGPPEGDLESLFDVFRTTRDDGLGMGLAISRSIIEAHGGRLDAGLGSPCGAVFRFTLGPDRCYGPPP